MYILQFGSLTTMFDFSHGSCAADGEYEQSLGGTQFQLVPLHPPNPNAFAFSGTFSENQESSVGILPQPLQFDESVTQPTQPRKTQRSRLGIKTLNIKGRSKRQLKKNNQKVQKTGQNRMTYRARKTPLKRRHSETTCDKDDNDTSSKFKETNASRLFKWPGKMIQKIFSEKPNGKPIHVQLWTEFSGAGTAEVALNGISSACHLLTSQVMGSADWAPHSRMALINNSTDASQHVFGDIADVCPSSMLEKAKRNVALTVPQQHHYVTMFECTYFSNFHSLVLLANKGLNLPHFLEA